MEIFTINRLMIALALPALHYLGKKGGELALEYLKGRAGDTIVDKAIEISKTQWYKHHPAKAWTPPKDENEETHFTFLTYHLQRARADRFSDLIADM